ESMRSAALDIERLPHWCLHGLVGPDCKLQFSRKGNKQVKLDIVVLMNRAYTHWLDLDACSANVRALPQPDGRVALRGPSSLFFGLRALGARLRQHRQAQEPCNHGYSESVSRH